MVKKDGPIDARECSTTRLFWRRYANFHPATVEEGAGKSGARLRLDAALEAVEDGHVAWMQVRRAVRRMKHSTS